MLERIDHIIEVIVKANKDKRTLTLAIGCVVAFGVAVGAVAVYEHLVNELEKSNGHQVFRRERGSAYYEEDEDEY